MATALAEAAQWVQEHRSEIKRRGLANIEDIMRGTLTQYLGQQEPDMFRSDHALEHHRGEIYACVRCIKERIAGQPIHVAQVVHARNVNGKKEFAPPAPGRKRLSDEEMHDLPVWVKEKIGIRQFAHKADTVRWLKAMHSEAARVDILEHHPVLELLASPNPRTKGSTLIANTVVSLEFTGKAYWTRTKPFRNRFFDIWHLPTDWVKESADNLQLDDEFIITPPRNPEPERVPASAMIYFYYPDPTNPVNAYAPVRAALQAVQIDESLQASQRAMFDNGILPMQAVITGDILNPEGKSMGKAQLERWQINQIRERLKHEHRGVNKHWEPIILDRVISDIKNLSLTPQEMAWKESAEINMQRIWRIMGVPRVVAGDVTDANRATAIVADSAFVGNCVNPKITMISMTLNDELLPLFGNDGLIMWIEEAKSVDREGRLKEIELAVDRRAISVNELRSEIGKPALPEGLGDVLVSTAMQVFEPMSPDAATSLADRDALIEEQAERDEVSEAGGASDYASADTEPGADVEAKSVSKGYAAAWLKIHGREEKRFAAALEEFIRRQMNHVIDDIQLSGRHHEGEAFSETSEWSVRLAESVFNPRDWDERLKKVAKPFLARQVALGAINMRRAMKGSVPTQKADDDVLMELPPRVLQMVRRYLAEMLESKAWLSINDTTAKRIAAALQAGLESGETLQQQVERIKQSLGGKIAANRAVLIARTETTASLNSGSRAVLDDLKQEGVSAGSQWLATKDNHTRATHWAADGQKSDANGNFTVGGHVCRFPCDPDLPAEERVNCRCTLISAEYQRGLRRGGFPHRPDFPGLETTAILEKAAGTLMAHRSERRYLLDDASDVQRQLQAHGMTRDYQCTTIYLDNQTPTWSLRGRGLAKFRLRQYADGQTFLEQKRSLAGLSEKERSEIDPDSLPPNLVPIGSTQYVRTEFEEQGSRVTIDRDVTINGKRFGKMIVEVKGEMPQWLSLPVAESVGFSKSSLMLGKV